MAKSIAAYPACARSTSSTRLTVSKNSAQSRADISPMLKITLLTVTVIADCR